MDRFKLFGDVEEEELTIKLTIKEHGKIDAPREKPTSARLDDVEDVRVQREYSVLDDVDYRKPIVTLVHPDVSTLILWTRAILEMCPRPSVVVSFDYDRLDAWRDAGFATEWFDEEEQEDDYDMDETILTVVQALDATEEDYRFGIGHRWQRCVCSIAVRPKPRPKDEWLVVRLPDELPDAGKWTTALYRPSGAEEMCKNMLWRTEMGQHRESVFSRYLVRRLSEIEFAPSTIFWARKLGDAIVDLDHWKDDPIMRYAWREDAKPALAGTSTAALKLSRLWKSYDAIAKKAVVCTTPDVAARVELLLPPSAIVVAFDPPDDVDLILLVGCFFDAYRLMKLMTSHRAALVFLKSIGPTSLRVAECCALGAHCPSAIVYRHLRDTFHAEGGL